MAKTLSKIVIKTGFMTGTLHCQNSSKLSGNFNKPNAKSKNSKRGKRGKRKKVVIPMQRVPYLPAFLDKR